MTAVTFNRRAFLAALAAPFAPKPEAAMRPRPIRPSKPIASATDTIWAQYSKVSREIGASLDHTFHEGSKH